VLGAPNAAVPKLFLGGPKSEFGGDPRRKHHIKKSTDCMGDFWQYVAKFDFTVANLLFSQVPKRYR